MDSFIYALVLVPALRDLLPRSGIPATTANIGYYGGLLFALFLVGWGLALIWGPFADRFGRVRTLMLTIVCFSLFTLMSAFATNIWALAVLRLFAGVGIGGEWAMGATLLSEEWPEGNLPTDGRQEVSAIIRQAIFLVKNRDQRQAEQLVTKALEKYLNDPALLAFLGWVYKAWDPPRLTDARENFTRAWQLNCRDEEMYKHWSRMEVEQHEWTKAAEAAERGLKLIADRPQLLFLAGQARSRLGRELKNGLHYERAATELTKAKTLFARALRAPESLEAGERRLNADVYRALVLTCETHGDVSEMREYFERWLSEHPDDPDAHSEWVRFQPRFGL